MRYPCQVGQSSTRPAIATTHTGSLPRPPELLEALRRDPSGAGLEPLAPAAVVEIVRRQREVGLDVVNDGELSKPGVSTYVTSRLGGFAEVSRPRRQFIEQSMFPEYYGGRGLPEVLVRACVGPITWHGDDAVRRDIENLLAAAPDGDAFLTAASPGLVWY